jgi:hypothetical protein
MQGKTRRKKSETYLEHSPQNGTKTLKIIIKVFNGSTFFKNSLT